MTENNVCPIRKTGQLDKVPNASAELSCLNSDDRKNLLRLLMGKLPYVDRVALALRFWENCSIEEISNFLGMDWEETDKRLNRSLKVLRVAIRDLSQTQNRSLTNLTQDLGLDFKAA